MPNPNPERTPETDPHLLAALRHAPDHDVAPPPSLNRRILDDARRAVRPARSERWWAWLMQPAGAAAFASVLMATVIGVMWRDGPPPEEQPAQAPQEQASRPAAPQPAPQQAQLPTLPAPLAEAPVAAVAKAVPAKPTRSLAKLPAPAAQRAREVAQAPAAVAPLVAAIPAAPAAMPAPSPSPAATGAVEMRRDAAAPGAARLAAPMMSAKSSNEATISNVEPLASLLTALALGSPAQAVLAELQRLAQGRWEAVGAAPAPSGTALQDAQARVLGHLSLEDDVALWQPANARGQAWRAVMPAATLALLRNQLERAMQKPRE